MSISMSRQSRLFQKDSLSFSVLLLQNLQTYYNVYYICITSCSNCRHGMYIQMWYAFRLCLVTTRCSAPLPNTCHVYVCVKYNTLAECVRQHKSFCPENRSGAAGIMLMIMHTWICRAPLRAYIFVLLQMSTNQQQQQLSSIVLCHVRLYVLPPCFHEKVYCWISSVNLLWNLGPWEILYYIGYVRKLCRLLRTHHFA